MIPHNLVHRTAKSISATKKINFRTPEILHAVHCQMSHAGRTTLTSPLGERLRSSM